MINWENFLFKKKDSVGLIQFNQPEKLNTFSLELFREMEVLIQAIEDDDELRCIVLTGTGKHFSAGFDVSILQETSAEWSRKNVFWLQRLLVRWENLSQPTIAAINGACIGGAIELTLACDIRIAAVDARFSFPEVSLGFSSDMGGSQRLPRVIGASQSKRLLLGGERFDAHEAARVGMVDEITEPEQLLERALELANKIAAQPHMSVRFAKKAVNLAMESSLNAGMLFEQVQSMFSLGTEDKKEATSAFLEKRTPQFKGR